MCKDKTCKTCRFWDSAATECRYYPPTINHKIKCNEDEDNLLVGWWPETLENEWCGKWEGEKK